MLVQANSYAPQNLWICRKESAEPAWQEWIKGGVPNRNLIVFNACSWVTLTHDTMMKTGQDICGSHRRPSDQLLSENITQDWFPIPILQKGQWYRKHCLAVSQLRAL